MLGFSCCMFSIETMVAIAGGGQIPYSLVDFAGHPMTRRARAIARPACAAKRWLTLLALLGFFLQSMAV